MMNANEKRQFATKYAQYERLLVLQGYAKATRDNYLRSLRRLAEWAGKCPDKRLKKKHFEAYFTQRIQSHSWSAVKVDRNAFMRYWELVLDGDWDSVNLVKPPVVKHLPDILKADELNHTFACVHKIHYHVFLYTVYTLGIRLAEGLNLKVGDIDGKAMRVHIREGKGCKDRFVILPDNTYTVLRQFWRTHKNKTWLFPSLQSARSHSPMDKGAAQKAMQLAIEEANIHKRVSVHNLRHSYATHCIEHGMDLCSLQQLLGHESPKTTAIYTQLTEKLVKNNRTIVNAFVNRVVMPTIQHNEDCRHED